jgi:hypothetical protein
LARELIAREVIQFARPMAELAERQGCFYGVYNVPLVYNTPVGKSLGLVIAVEDNVLGPFSFLDTNVRNEPFQSILFSADLYSRAKQNGQVVLSGEYLKSLIVLNRMKPYKVKLKE